MIRSEALKRLMPLSSDFAETLKHGRIYFSASAALKGLSIIGIPIMTRLLTPEDYGILNIFAVYTTIAATVFTLNLNVGVSRYFFEKHNDFNSFLGTATIIPFALLCFSFIVLISFPDQFAWWLDLPVITIYFLVPIAMTSFLKGVHLHVFRAKRESKKVRSLSIIAGYIGFVLGIALVYFHEIEGRYEGKLWSGLIMVFIIGFIVVKRIWPLIKLHFKWDHLKYMVSYGLPLLPANLSGFILMQFDRVMIGSYLGKGEAGQYSFAYNISMLQVMIMNALYYSWSPKYYEYMNNKDYKSHDKDVVKLLAIISFVACGLILFADWIGYILGSQSFHKSLYLIPIIIIGQYMMAIIPIYKRHISYSKKTIYTSIIILLAGALNIVLNAIFIPRMGAIAGAYTTVISYAFLCVLTFLVVKYIIKSYTTPTGKIIGKVFVVFIACSYYYLNLNYLDLHIIWDILSKFGVLSVCFIALFWSYIIPILQKIKTS
jgi:O-antigen/teichoic acid export membrane protein